MTAAERTEARRVLLDHFDVLTDAGHPPTCWTVPLPERACWTADDPAEQAVAARLCQSCPALTACREYGTAFPKEYGVYGGRTDTQRRPRRGRPTKENTHV